MSKKTISALFTFRCSLFTFGVMAVVAAGCTTEGIGKGFEGGNPAISRDGRYMAFQRVEGTHMHLGVLELKTGKIEWIVRGATEATKNENACHPSWGPDNTLIYAYANLTNTAYQRFSSKAAHDGYRLRTWKNGETRELVGGLARHFSPSFSPDGKTVYCCRQTQRFTGLARMDASGSGNPDEFISNPPYDGGLSQPVPSPDGKYLAYAELADRNWTIKVVALASPHGQRSVVPGIQTAYAPNWTPDGLHLVYTGFTPGDPCWGVYITSLRDRSTKRLADGTDPCVTPDGKWVYYERDGFIHRIPLDEKDYPVAAVRPPNPRGEAPRTLSTFAEGTTMRCSKQFTFPTNDLPAVVSYHFGFKFDWDGRKSAIFLFAGSLEGAGSVWVLVRNGCISVHGLSGDSQFVASDGIVLSKGTHDFRCVHGSDGVVYASVDRGPWMARSCPAKSGPLTGKGSYMLLSGTSGEQFRVYDVEMGIGWPK